MPKGALNDDDAQHNLAVNLFLVGQDCFIGRNVLGTRTEEVFQDLILFVQDVAEKRMRLKVNDQRNEEGEGGA